MLIITNYFAILNYGRFLPLFPLSRPADAWRAALMSSPHRPELADVIGSAAFDSIHVFRGGAA
jgi:hypothetical protein